MISFKPVEEKLFGTLFNVLDQSQSGYVSGQQLVHLFQYSGLDQQTKALIWKIASRGEAVLSKYWFYCACRLVAIAQNGVPLTNEVLMQQFDVPLPRFGGPIEQYYLGLNVNFSGQAQSQMISSPPQTPNALPGNNLSPQKSSSPWEVNGSEFQNYLKYFKEADTNGDSFINGKEFKEFFGKFGISEVFQRDVWSLSDTDYDNKLNKNEFVIAMHLVARFKKQKLSVPEKLPAELRALLKVNPDTYGKEEDKSPHPNIRNSLARQSSFDSPGGLLMPQLSRPSSLSPPMSPDTMNTSFQMNMYNANASNPMYNIAQAEQMRLAEEYRKQQAFLAEQEARRVQMMAEEEAKRLADIEIKKAETKRIQEELDLRKRQEEEEFRKANERMLLETIKSSIEEANTEILEYNSHLNDERRSLEESQQLLSSLKAKLDVMHSFQNAKKNGIYEINSQANSLKLLYNDLVSQYHDASSGLNDFDFLENDEDSVFIQSLSKELDETLSSLQDLRHRKKLIESAKEMFQTRVLQETEYLKKVQKESSELSNELSVTSKQRSDLVLQLEQLDSQAKYFERKKEPKGISMYLSNPLESSGEFKVIKKDSPQIVGAYDNKARSREISVEKKSNLPLFNERLSRTISMDANPFAVDKEISWSNQDDSWMDELPETKANDLSHLEASPQKENNLDISEASKSPDRSKELSSKEIAQPIIPASRRK
jgi:hypothetical protein